MNLSLSMVTRFLTVSVLGASLLGFSGQNTVAQDAPPSLIEHLRSSLQSESDLKRSHALVDIIALADCNESCIVNLRSVDEKTLAISDETGTGGVVELNALVPDLIETYRSGPADGHRLLALSALINIGNERALEQLIDEGASQSESTNRATQRSLAAYYLEKYPELVDHAVSTKRLSVQDVHRAKALRLQQAEN